MFSKKPTKNYKILISFSNGPNHIWFFRVILTIVIWYEGLFHNQNLQCGLLFLQEKDSSKYCNDIIQHISMTLPAWGFCKTFKRCSRREPDSYITNLMICQNSKRDVKGQKIILVQGIRIRIFAVIQFLTGIDKIS